MSKIRIDDDAPANAPLYAHLDPVINYLLSTGNELATPFRWGSNWEGFYCHLRKDIDFDELERKFDFPESIKLYRESNTIFCEKTGCMIKGRAQ